MSRCFSYPLHGFMSSLPSQVTERSSLCPSSSLPLLTLIITIIIIFVILKILSLRKRVNSTERLPDPSPHCDNHQFVVILTASVPNFPHAFFFFLLEYFKALSYIISF